MNHDPFSKLKNKSFARTRISMIQKGRFAIAQPFDAKFRIALTTCALQQMVRPIAHFFLSAGTTLTSGSPNNCGVTLPTCTIRSWIQCAFSALRCEHSCGNNRTTSTTSFNIRERGSLNPTTTCSNRSKAFRIYLLQW